MKRLRLFALVVLILSQLPVIAEAAVEEKGARVFVCGHSFHIYIADLLKVLAAEDGMTKHRTVGSLMRGDSRVSQMWDVPAEKNTAKAALAAGEVDVLTLSPHREMPDPGIDRFADLAIAHNPRVRVLVQMSWSKETKARPDPAYWAPRAGLYLGVLRAQLEEINRRHGVREMALVPAGGALLILLERLREGKVPGLTDAGQLFSDDASHPAAPLKNLVAFCYYGAIYGKSPAGLRALDSKATPREMNQALQEIAWEALLAEPMSGVGRP